MRHRCGSFPWDQRGMTLTFVARVWSEEGQSSLLQDPMM